jgi:hypothetical protein
MSAILVIGEPGTGKSAAIEGLDPRTTVIIKPNNKDLPWGGWETQYNEANKNFFRLKTMKAVGDTIVLINKAPHIKTLILEDFTHYISGKVMADMNTKGYEKWTELAVQAFLNIIEKATEELRPDLDFVLIGHVSVVSDATSTVEVGLQTAGKLMDNIIKIPSYFTYIFHATVDYSGDEPLYQFQTNRDGVRLAKTPKGYFPLHIPNDYKAVFERIRECKLDKSKLLKIA